MPVRPTYPGVYIEEIPSGVRTITGVATSTAAFVGTSRRGLVDEAVQLFSMADFDRKCGGLGRDHEASYAVQQFFQNGGSEAWFVRIVDADAASPNPAVVANLMIQDSEAAPNNVVQVFAGGQIRGGSAIDPGTWGNSVRLDVDYDSSSPTELFNLTVSEVQQQGDRTIVVSTETFRNLTLEPNRANNAIEVVNRGSSLIQLTRDPTLVSETSSSGASITGFASPLPSPWGATFRPAASGTLGIELPAWPPPLPSAGNTFDITLAGGSNPAFPITVTATYQPATAPASYSEFRAALERAIRATASDPLITKELKSLLADATVNLVGAGGSAPNRLHVRLGRGARPFDPDTTVELTDAGGTNPATAAGLTVAAGATVNPQQFRLVDGNDGRVIDASSGAFLVPASMFEGTGDRQGIQALEDVDLFNILCIPEAALLGDTDMRAVYAAAEEYVEDRRAMLIVDIPPTVVSLDQMQTWIAENSGLRHPNGAVYFPRTRIPDPLDQNRPRSIGASGTIAGLYARTDGQRGVWKAPAGVDARLRGVDSLDMSMTDQENGALNPIGVNCLRNFPIYANICWGARTLEGADQIASDWKYVPVRRLTLFLEESLYRGTKWVVFEPNDEPLWSQIRLNVGAFMQDLYRKGAFQGASPRDAYFVRCDSTTTTQNDIDNGIVNIEVGFAPLKPAEFVIIKIQQIARRAEA
jgi:phage tail sheath protein FI